MTCIAKGQAQESTVEESLAQQPLHRALNAAQYRQITQRLQPRRRHPPHRSPSPCKTTAQTQSRARATAPRSPRATRAGWPARPNRPPQTLRSTTRGRSAPQTPARARGWSRASRGPCASRRTRDDPRVLGVGVEELTQTVEVPGVLRSGAPLARARGPRRVLVREEQWVVGVKGVDDPRIIELNQPLQPAHRIVVRAANHDHSVGRNLANRGDRAAHQIVPRAVVRQRHLVEQLKDDRHGRLAETTHDLLPQPHKAILRGGIGEQHVVARGLHLEGVLEREPRRLMQVKDQGQARVGTPPQAVIDVGVPALERYADRRRQTPEPGNRQGVARGPDPTRRSAEYRPR